jgi:ankyrin repeat protein
MRNYIKYFIYLSVFSWFSLAQAGVYEDFFRSIHANDAASVQFLVEVRGVDPNWPNEKGEPALTLALFLESDKVARYLATVPQLRTEVTNVAGETPLMLAAITRQMDVAQTLIDRGAEVNRPGWTPLHYAATSGHIPMIRLMLENSAYIDAEAPNGNTPLMMAVQFATPAAVKLLLEEGADPNVKNRHGQTARDLAALNKNPQTAYYIEAFLDAWRVNDARDRGELN